MRELADNGEQGDHIDVGKTKWLKLFHRSVFSIEGFVRGLEALARKCLARPKLDTRVFKAG